MLYLKNNDSTRPNTTIQDLCHSAAANYLERSCTSSQASCLLDVNVRHWCLICNFVLHFADAVALRTGDTVNCYTTLCSAVFVQRVTSTVAVCAVFTPTHMQQPSPPFASTFAQQPSSLYASYTPSLLCVPTAPSTSFAASNEQAIKTLVGSVGELQQTVKQLQAKMESNNNSNICGISSQQNDNRLVQSRSNNDVHEQKLFVSYVVIHIVL